MRSFSILIPAAVLSIGLPAPKALPADAAGTAEPEARPAEPRDDPAATSTGPPQGQEGAPGNGDGRPPTFYETTTVTARPVSSATGGVTVVDTAELQAAEARSGSDALRAVPGLNLLPTGGRPGVTHSWIRGADPNFTLVLLDGIPINDPTGRQGGAVNLEEIPGGLVDRVEVVRGPQTSFYGMSALSGVVHLFAPRGRPGPTRVTAGAEMGNAGLRRAFGRASGSAGQGGWAAGLSYDEEEFRIADERFRQVDAWATADLRLGSEADLGLTARFATGRQDDYPNGSGGPVYGSGEVRQTEHDDLALGARLGVGRVGGRRHVLSVGLSRRAMERGSPAIPPLVPASEESTSYDRLRLAWQVPLHVDGRTQVDVGASGEAEWARNQSVLELPPGLGGDVSGDYDEARASGGVFGAFRQERGAFLYELSLRLDGASGLGAQLNPQAGVVWSPGSGSTRLRASAGRATKLASFFALSSPPALGGNPDLKPETTVGGEIGFEHDAPSARLSFGAAYFLNEYRDLVDFDFDRFTHVNRARVRSQGVELTARWQPHETLWLTGEVTFIDAEDRSEDAAPLLYQPRWLGGARLTWQPTPRLRLRLEARAVASYLDNQIPVPDRDTVPGYGLYGLAASWRFHRGWTLRARIDNLAGRRYETYIGFPGPQRAWWVGLGWDRLPI